MQIVRIEKYGILTTKAHKGYSQRTQSVIQQRIIFVSLCVYFVFLVVRKKLLREAILKMFHYLIVLFLDIYISCGFFIKKLPSKEYLTLFSELEIVNFTNLSALTLIIFLFE